MPVYVAWTALKDFFCLEENTSMLLTVLRYCQVRAAKEAVVIYETLIHCLRGRFISTYYYIRVFLALFSVG